MIPRSLFSLRAATSLPHRAIHPRAIHTTRTPCHKPRPTTEPPQNTDVEQDIWSCIRYGNIHQAVAISANAHRRQGADRGSPALSPLIQFMLLKRKLSADCLYAGLFALQQQSGLEAGRGRFDLLYAAMLADGDAGLVQLYADMQGDRRRAEQMDTVLLASVAYCLCVLGDRRRMHMVARQLLPRARRAVEWAAKSPVSLRSLVNGDTARSVDAAWSLRRPTAAFSDVQAAGVVVLDLLRRDIVPDQAVLETLLSSSVRTRDIPPDVLSLYATQKQSFGLSSSTLVRLVGMRSSLGRHLPRVHYDVLCTLVRLGRLKGALTVAAGLRSRQMFHFLLSLWKKTYADDWRALGAITQCMVESLDGRILHSTHHLVLSATLDMFKAARRRQGGRQAGEILDAALALHWRLAPRLETPSVAAVHQLITQLAGNRMCGSAFHVYRDAEQRVPQWAPSRRAFATEAILAALARGLAQAADTRSIMHLASAATRLGILISSHFYTAVICGLTDPLRMQTTSGYHAQMHPDALRRVQTAEAMLEIMRRNHVAVPPKVLFAVMHAWALLGNTRKARGYARRVRRLADERVVGMHAWGMVMHAFMRAQDAQGAVNVLYQAREWLRAHKLVARGDAGRTSYLVNTAMAALVRAGRSREALSLLDASIDQAALNEDGALAATAADPVTLSLVIGALLAEHRLAQAMAVYGNILSRHGLAENPAEVRRLLRYALRFGHLDAALELTARLLRANGRLRESQWIRLLQLSFGSGRYATVHSVYACMCACIEPHVMLGLLARHPGVLELAQRANEELGGPVGRVKYSAGYRAVSLYRRLLRAVAGFPVREMRGKLRHNVRFCYELHRDLDPGDPQIPRLITDGHVQAEWLEQWQRDPRVVEQIWHRGDK